MELTYPLVFILLIPVVLVLVFLNPVKLKKTKAKLKIANVSAVKNTPEYKKLVLKYRIGVSAVFSLAAFAIIFSTILLARPASVSSSDSEVYNRDIVFCTDISFSIFELNLDVIDALKSTVAGLKGDRFGISMFNSSSVTVSPLTEDYNYINTQLDKIAESIKCNEDDAKCDSWVTTEFINNGTIYEAETRGGSLIGDGLVSCTQLFNTKTNSKGEAVLDESRTKIIIFSTDNELGTIGGIFSREPGKPLFTTTEAMDYAAKKGIVVYGIGTANIKSSDESVMKAGVEKTGGKYYASKNMNVKDIIASIDSTSKSLLEGQTETKRNDHPEIFAVILAVLVITMFIFVKGFAL